MTNITAVVVIALTLFGEAAGEPLAGKQAVASVIYHRAEREGTGGFVGVCRAPRQFSCWNNGATPQVPDDAPSWRAYRQCWQIADSMVAGRFTTTVDADHYHADYVTPGWAGKMEHVGTVGRHRFYRSDKLFTKIIKKGLTGVE